MRRLSRQVEPRANELLVRAAIAANQTLILATPVDTGRARANWQANVGSAITSATNNVDPSGGGTITRNNAVISSRRAGSDQAIHITNNVDYIGQLNAGSSAQAPAGFVEAAVQTAVNTVRRLARGVVITRG